MRDRYSSKTDYLRTKRSCECVTTTSEYKSCVNTIRNKCKTEYNVHPLKIGHSEKEVYNSTLLPGRYQTPYSQSDTTRYQFIHRDTTRSGYIRRTRLQVLKSDESSSNINQSVSCNDIEFE